MASSSSVDKKALVVDDDSGSRLIAMTLARKCGFKTIGATNGQEAVDLYKAGERFNMVIMDMQMPIIDGIHATRIIRSLGADDVILGATASDDEHEKALFKEAGLDHLVSRPLTKAKLDQFIS